MPYYARRRKGVTRLARVRVWRGLEQEALAKAAGISVATLRRIETDADANPPLRYLANLALVLNVSLEDVIEPHWTEWTQFNERTPAEPPEPRGLLFHPKETRAPGEVREAPKK